MQPYFMPYIGYFQMIGAVDKFVFYDDVNFIKQGWINRNRILNNKTDFLFIVPVEKVSSFTLINKTKIKKNLYPTWKNKFLKTIQSNYSKAPYFENIFELINSIIGNDFETIDELAVHSIKKTAEYLGIKTDFVISSECYQNKGMEKQSRLIDVCKQEKASQYINAIGGRELYTKEAFAKEGIQLSFIEPKPIEYKQFNNEFVPWLSIIDVLMFNSVDETKEMLLKYELV